MPNSWAFGAFGTLVHADPAEITLQPVRVVEKGL
jgi:hypothetical protein